MDLLLDLSRKAIKWLTDLKAKNVEMDSSKDVILGGVVEVEDFADFPHSLVEPSYYLWMLILG